MKRERERESKAIVAFWLCSPAVRAVSPAVRAAPPGMRPTASLIAQLQSGGQLWASGTFRGLEDWVAEYNIEVVVNLLGRPHVRVANWEEWDMNSEQNEAW